MIKSITYFQTKVVKCLMICIALHGIIILENFLFFCGA